MSSLYVLLPATPVTAQTELEYVESSNELKVSLNR